ncbi:AHH domain-containing protein [Bacillus manliponensis]
MDVRYKPEEWQDMKEGIDKITKEAIPKLKEMNRTLEDVEAKIRELDSDRSIHFSHTNQEKKLHDLLDDYIELGNYCTKVGEVVSRHFDKPFLEDMDAFAGKIRDLSIKNYKTDNRIGATTTTTIPSAHGYGQVQTITTKKDEITVDDIFKESVAFEEVLKAQYKEIKKQNPDAELSYEQYRDFVPSMRGFEYETIAEGQKKLESWRDLAITGALIILTIAVPPVGIAASVAYGGLQLKSAIEGKDWGTGRELTAAERAENGVFGVIDAIPVIGVAGKAFRATESLVTLNKLSKIKDVHGVKFTANKVSDVVQLLQNNKNTLFDRMKLASLKVEKYGNEKMYQLGEKVAKSIDDRTAKSQSYDISGNGTMVAKQGGTDLHGWVNKHHTESSKIIDDKIKSVEASLAKGTGEATRLIPGTPGKVTGGSSTKLGQNLLESMGLPRSASWKGYQAQHIIPKNLRNHPVLKRIGMDMDHADNGIFLPIPAKDPSALSRHRGFHSVYNNVVKDQLDKLNINQSIKELEQQVFELQQKLKKGTESGLPLYKSKVLEIGIEKFYKTKLNEEIKIWQRGGGATEELWERWINK